jgi:hypothetical protein
MAAIDVSPRVNVAIAVAIASSVMARSSLVIGLVGSHYTRLSRRLLSISLLTKPLLG